MKLSALKYLKMALLTIGTTFSAMAQNNGGIPVPLVAQVPEEAKIPAEAQDLLLTRLDQMIVKQGFGGMRSLNNRFVMVPKLTQIDRNISPGGPPQMMLNMELNLFIVDTESKRTLATLTQALNGAGPTEEKAILMALRNTQWNTDEQAAFVNKGRSEIINFYTQSCDRIMQEAKNLIYKNRSTEALNLLASVPVEAEDCFKKASDLLPLAFQNYLMVTCDANFQKARAYLAAMNEDSAAFYLSLIPSYSPCGKKADAEIAKLSKQSQMKYRDNFTLRTKRIDRDRELFRAQAETAREFAYFNAARGIMPTPPWRWFYGNR